MEIIVQSKIDLYKLKDVDVVIDKKYLKIMLLKHWSLYPDQIIKSINYTLDTLKEKDPYEINEVEYLELINRWLVDVPLIQLRCKEAFKNKFIYLAKISLTNKLITENEDILNKCYIVLDEQSLTFYPLVIGINEEDIKELIKE